MQKTKQLESMPINLNEESFFRAPTPHSFEQALARGIIIEVTKWVQASPFGTSLLQKRYALTVKLWNTLLQAYIQTENEKLDRLLMKPRNDLFHVAALALAQSEGCNAIDFSVQIPTVVE